ncbi:unnamed protein product [Spirodela intermedia]|uniref:Uncharacterized protein n=1 Tax=Spirodela intermedia TaxID=51605 RepID=A0A7I8IN09_SPIIN|nr:unnamed protein product [Spirodela intermedia]CAA6658842.1 unnamed protein product [Spirodela intermedia]
MKQLIKKEGKRTRVRAISYKTFHRPARTERDVIKQMVDAVDNMNPIGEVEKSQTRRSHNFPLDCSHLLDP